MRGLFFIKLPHTPKRLLCFPSLSHSFFPKSKSWELLAELKSYNTLICWRSWLTWLNYSGRAKRVLEKFCFVKMTTQRSAPVSESLDSGETSIAATWEILPWKSSRPNNSKAAGLERIIHVVKDSTNLPARAKFGPNLDFLGLNYNISWHSHHQSWVLEEFHCNASDAKPVVASCQLWECRVD